MRKIVILFVAIGWFAFPGCRDQQPVNVPHQVGGFTLGADIADYQDRLQPETELPVRYREYIHEIEARKSAGFKSGLISYGKCDMPGRIVRIKLKYADPTREFYDALFEQFKLRFGEPTEWRGDSFQVVIAWKWRFVDESGNTISLILQHNTQDVEQKMGNSIKLTSWSQAEKERQCYESQLAKTPSGKPAGAPNAAVKRDLSWDVLIPR